LLCLHGVVALNKDFFLGGVPDHLWVSPTEIHGALGSVNQLSICVGILLALIAGLPLVNNPAWYGTQPTDRIVKDSGEAYHQLTNIMLNFAI
jgi:hypothetical protein